MKLKLHNALWAGLVGKEPGTDHPPIGLDRMLELTATAEVNGQKFDGVDLILAPPHLDANGSESEWLQVADKVAAHNLRIGSIVAPVWENMGGGSAMGSKEDRSKFVAAVKKACHVGDTLRKHGVRRYGAIRIDSADNPKNWATDRGANTDKIAVTFREAGDIAADWGERLVAEGEICWAAMHTWQNMVDLLEAVDMPKVVGFQADEAHTYLYLLSPNAPEHATLKPGHTAEEFQAAYPKMVKALRPWTFDFHVAQNDGTVHGTGDHEKTGRHCPPDDPNGKLDIVKCAAQWLEGAQERGIQHICWDGCMFPNEVLENPKTWNTILETMIKVRDVHDQAA